MHLEADGIAACCKYTVSLCVTEGSSSLGANIGFVFSARPEQKEPAAPSASPLDSCQECDACLDDGCICLYFVLILRGRSHRNPPVFMCL